MKTIQKLFLFIPLLITSCSTNNDVSSTDGSNGDDSFNASSEQSVDASTNPLAKNYYQLLVYSFADSNGDGIGDFKGIVDHLDYLVDMGIEGLWLSPIHKCKSYHGYDVMDYYKINSAYQVKIGSKTYDYKYLLDECHKKNISVIMDLVINHTSNSHVWKTEHPRWYVADSQGAFQGGMSDLNYELSEVKEEMKNVGKYWLQKGFDGFRLDAAMWLYNENGDKASGINHNKNYTYWKEWCKAMKKAKSNCYIIGEVLNSNHDLAYEYAKAGFDSTFDFNVREHVYNAVTNSNYDYVGKTITDMNKALTINSNYILGRSLSNHDIGRFSQEHYGMDDADAYYLTTFKELRLANALNIMMRGNTFIYYGDELGLVGSANGAQPKYYNDLNFRTPMPWSTNKGLTQSTSYFTNEVPGNKTTTTTTLSGKTANEDAVDSSSLYTVMSELLNLKKDNNVIKNGAVAKLNNLPSGLKGYKLSDDNETISFIYNPTNKAISFEKSGNILYSTDGDTNNISISSKGFIVMK